MYYLLGLIPIFYMVSRFSSEPNISDTEGTFIILSVFGVLLILAGIHKDNFVEKLFGKFGFVYAYRKMQIRSIVWGICMIILGYIIKTYSETVLKIVEFF
jgi:hypothetical protein